jgi:hypothetical protein
MIKRIFQAYVSLAVDRTPNLLVTGAGHGPSALSWLRSGFSFQSGRCLHTAGVQRHREHANESAEKYILSHFVMQ